MIAILEEFRIWKTTAYRHNKNVACRVPVLEIPIITIWCCARKMALASRDRPAECSSLCGDRTLRSAEASFKCQTLSKPYKPACSVLTICQPWTRRYASARRAGGLFSNSVQCDNVCHTSHARAWTVPGLDNRHSLGSDCGSVQTARGQFSTGNLDVASAPDQSPCLTNRVAIRVAL